MRPIYLDHNATTPVRRPVADAMRDAMDKCGNASSVHASGRRARAAIDDAREAVAALVGASAADVVFTSGGTEANNLALCATDSRRVLVSAVEHLSVLQAHGHADVCPVDEEGRIELDALRQWLDSAGTPALVSVMLANNETGVIQPLRQVAEICQGANALLHCDAVQAAGKIDVDWRELGADMLSLSAHKIGGPQGVGALIVNQRAGPRAIISGGGQERGRRAGTENLPGIVGFGVAADIAANANSDAARLQAMRGRIEDRISEFAADARFHGAGAPRLGNTSCIHMPGVLAETQVMALDLEGIMVSAGSACSSGKVRASHVLLAMGIAADRADQAIRVSLGWDSEDQDIDEFVAAWRRIYERLGSARASAA
ncbi:MAG: cysteine desulfurase family protein [Rhodospirillales bacterium]|mgnify:CR=1 FL=1|jgi:cysteine desulfurase|nr:cysteine desulfurase [Rhodospirillaceae bacterium]MDP6430340.1 cysteine desulfurase family protein [Rhodospirillales bacterium]MDP6646060.1 cysteine desulfurase family protein [Rhodospirillales bacterium]MDP6841169.1 cysteine desulfurase family protein [Rhodospirillales bacterium]